MDFDKLMEYQNMLQQRLRKEQQIDRKIELLSIINQLTFGPKNIVQKENIIIEAQSRGFSEDEIEDLLQKLIQENIIYEPSPGFIKKR
jgi:DNA replicative helicase MCM subunit Mcm2 (Cdc46/Mcm family)